MMRALASVAIVAIIAVTVLVIWLTARRRAVKREQLRELVAENDRLTALLYDVGRETAAQIAAGSDSHAYTASLLKDFLRKEIAR